MPTKNPTVDVPAAVLENDITGCTPLIIEVVVAIAHPFAATGRVVVEVTAKFTNGVANVVVEVIVPFPKYAEPPTLKENRGDGVVEAIPTAPLLLTLVTINDGVELPWLETVNAVEGPISIESLADGVEVPIPIRPEIPPGIIARAGTVDVANVVGDDVAK